jgi:hypothetical protein
MTPATITMTEQLAEYTLDAMLSDYLPGATQLWQYVIYLGGTQNDQVAMFKIAIFGVLDASAWPLQLGQKYTLELVPIESATGGVTCTGATESTVMNTGQPVSPTTYTYTLAFEAQTEPNPNFDAFTLTPKAPLPLVVGQVYNVKFALASAVA